LEKVDQHMSVAATIRQRLEQALRPTRLDIVDESHLHAGHSAQARAGESHFRVLVVSQEFAGKSRLARHRLINELLAEQLATKVHALAIHAYAPGEAVREAAH
jgi:BolA family transcriptional regulator, general stress-responsive regulator